MTSYLTIEEVAKLLNLHPQTIYRKCKKNELPYVRFGRTMRIPGNQLGSVQVRPAKQSSIPSFMTRLFWEYDPIQLKPSDQIVLERILELGDVPEWRWLKNQVERAQICHFLLQLGKKRLSLKSFHFWAKLFGVNHEPRHSSKSSTKSLESVS